LHDKVISQVNFEIEQVDQLLISYADLLNRVQTRVPDLVELTALASILHSFYNGLENIFLSISKGIDGDTPQGSHWHRDLLTQMSKPTPGRAAVLTEETSRQLADYLAFRHFYRHAYSFFLEWDEIANLVASLADVWALVRAQLIQFIEEL